MMASLFFSFFCVPFILFEILHFSHKVLPLKMNGEIIKSSSNPPHFECVLLPHSFSYRLHLKVKSVGFYQKIKYRHTQNAVWTSILTFR